MKGGEVQQGKRFKKLERESLGKNQREKEKLETFLLEFSDF